jgi:hypothetical protein
MKNVVRARARTVEVVLRCLVNVFPAFFVNAIPAFYISFQTLICPSSAGWNPDHAAGVT